ncbi:hypothetical protein Slin15195_G106340 [Septoria linicola]|uniref:Uncharacterized protein n=1 Tax=Septoria linicola TaxID=215465 RepID=A0A9Q9ENR1_9PEZI|nr:hypothetical protein Slin15195_G106340 [Septoria linicola]
MTSRLEALPAELLDLVVDLAGPHHLDRTSAGFKRSIKTYGAICLASRTLYSIGRPYLYRFIRTQDIGDKIQPLLRTLSRQPSLAAQVKELHLRPACDSSTLMSSDDLDKCWPVVEKALGKDELLPRAQRAFTRGRGCRAWEMLLLLALTTKIKTLVYFIDYSSFDETEPCIHCPDMEQVLKSILIAGSASLYSRLTDARIVGTKTDGIADTEHSILSPLMSMPNVTNLVGVSIRPGPARHFLCAPQTSNISDLHLQECLLDTDSLLRILSTCKALVRLCIDWGTRWHDRFLDTRAFHAELLRHKSSLAALTMSDANNATLAYFQNGTTILAKGLSQFHQLTTLHLDEVLLFGEVDWAGIPTHELSGEYDLVLPPALREFTISSQQDLRALPNTISVIRSSLPASVRHVQILFGSGADWALKCKGYFLREFRQRRKPALQWIVRRTPRSATQNNSSFSFHCWRTTHPVDIPLRDVLRLADNGGGADAVIDYLYPREAHKRCHCRDCAARPVGTASLRTDHLGNALAGTG